MYHFQELLEATLEEMCGEVTSHEELANLEAKIRDVIPSLADEVAQSMLVSLKSDAPSMLRTK